MHPIVNIADLEPISRSAMSDKGGVSQPPERFGGSMAQVGRNIGAKHLGYNFVGRDERSLDYWDGE